MTKPLPDRAEVALEYPEKLYIGTFDRSSRFEAHFDVTGLSLTLERTGDSETRKTVSRAAGRKWPVVERFTGILCFARDAVISAGATTPLCSWRT